MTPGMLKAVAEHAGFTEQDMENFRCFVHVLCFDPSDLEMVAVVRYCDEEAPDEWFYRYFRLLDPLESVSLRDWEIVELCDTGCRTNLI